MSYNNTNLLKLILINAIKKPDYFSRPGENALSIILQIAMT